jgi:hypothetical protein
MPVWAHFSFGSRFGAVVDLSDDIEEKEDFDVRLNCAYHPKTNKREILFKVGRDLYKHSATLDPNSGSLIQIDVPGNNTVWLAEITITSDLRWG